MGVALRHHLECPAVQGLLFGEDDDHASLASNQTLTGVFGAQLFSRVQEEEEATLHGKTEPCS